MSFNPLMSLSVYIKNMVCPRCVATVEAVFQESGIAYEKVSLGEVKITGKISDKQKDTLTQRLKKHGFEWLQEADEVLINEIKSVLINKIWYDEKTMTFALPELLSKHFAKSYSSLSKLFKQHENRSIEQFVINQKIERAKELMADSRLNISEIARKLGYSSVQYLSRQFKQQTGISPTQYQQQQKKAERQFIDEL